MCLLGHFQLLHYISIMTRFLILFLLLVNMALHALAQDTTFITPFEKSKGLESASYTEAMDWYQRLDNKYDRIRMVKIGLTDTKYLLDMVMYSKDMGFDIRQWRKENKLVILINNAIHAGEPDGVDASMMLLRDAASGKINMPDNVVLIVIPVFNIGGALNRNSASRANQNGPLVYGTRGNAQHLDLNRDFIKMDARETRALETLYYQVNPDIFVDNHVSDGADYQHVMTLLPTQHNKLGGAVGEYQYAKLVPDLYKRMKDKGYDLVPYVNQFSHTPDSGWTEFYDAPRFSSGYAALYHSFAFVPETHMLKPFKQRVEATYALLESIIASASQNATEILKARQKDINDRSPEMAIDWKLDSTRFDKVTFKGYEAAHKPSLVSGASRLYYDRNKPYTRKVPFYNWYSPSLKVKVPKAYVLTQGYYDVVNRLEWNGVIMNKVKDDSEVKATVTYIESYESSPTLSEKHYPHHKVKVREEQETVVLQPGDMVISTDNFQRSYIVQTLEAIAPDGFFVWNFFDGILQQKEFYSDYVFEDEAAELLKKDKELNKLFTDKKNSDPAFAKNPAAQLDFIYKHSAHYDNSVNRYPVYKLY
jgi:Zinc carboxypeptidase